MKNYLYTFLLLACWGTSSAHAAIRLDGVKCRFSDQAGMKLTLDLTKQKNVAGYTMLSQNWGESKRWIRKINVLSQNLKYKAEHKARTGQRLPSQDVSISSIRVFRQDPKDAFNSMVEVSVPGETTLRANNPRTAKSYVITTGSILFTNGVATNLKGVCWK